MDLDPLTGLGTRTAVEAWLTSSVDAGVVPHEPPAVTGAVLAVVDLADFAGVNVEFGHRAGDEVLQVIGERLVALAGPDGVAARVGGDAFVVGVPSGTFTPHELGRRVLDVISLGVEVRGQEAILGGNVGAVVAGLAEPVGSVVRRLELALDRARHQGGGAIVVAGAREESPFDPQLSTDLHHALERGELRVHYLPMVDLESCELLGVEALVRWERDGSMLEAQRFLSLAEKTGRIVPIGRWAMATACTEVARWSAQHPERRPLRLSVNLSLRQLTEPDAVTHIEKVLADSGLAPDQLCLEITENSLSELGEAVGDTLLALKDLGIRLAVDDFGTGASSLVALQRHHLDEIKIDRSFVAQMDGDGDATALVRGVISLARSLGLDTVAEGVERPAQEQMLRGLQCHAAQGWLYSRPGGDLDVVTSAAEEALQASLERRPAEHAALREGMPTALVAARFVEAVFETAPIGMALVDGTGRHLACNPALARLLGRTEAELVDGSCWEVVHPEDLQDDLAGMDALLSGEQPSYVVEERIVDASGNLRWVEVTVSGVPGDHQAAGSPTRLLRQVRSIEDERRASEEAGALRSLVMTSPDALIMLDERGRCTQWNPAAEVLFGWSAVEMVGSPITRLVSGEDQLRLARALSAAASGETIRWADATWLARGGEQRPARVTIGPMVDTADRTIGLVARVQDMADERAADRALRDAVQEAEARAGELAEANDRLARFASTVSHDLMQPVAVLSGFLSLLDHGLELGEEHRVWLDGAIRGKDRVQQAIESLYRHAAAEQIPVEPVDLGAVLRDLSPGLLLELGDAELEVGELPVVLGDAGLIVQVLANVVHNSGRYRSAERPLVVRVDAAPEPRSWVVSITDTGEGICDHELERVFEPGARGAAAEGTDGTGSGLATVRALMRRMRGDAWAEPSHPGARICLRFSAPG